MLEVGFAEKVSIPQPPIVFALNAFKHIMGFLTPSSPAKLSARIGIETENLPSAIFSFVSTIIKGSYQHFPERIIDR